MKTQISIQPIETQLPTPQFPFDPSNPISWIILLTLFLTRADKTIESTTQLLQSLTDLLKTLTPSKPSEPQQDQLPSNQDRTQPIRLSGSSTGDATEQIEPSKTPQNPAQTAAAPESTTED